MKRTHTCGGLDEKSVGKKVVLNGWIATRRDHGSLTFVDVRDRYGTTQVVFNPEVNKKAHEVAAKLKDEFVVSVQGTVAERPNGTENPKIPTGRIEIVADTVEILNESEALPFPIESRIPVNEDMRLKYRYLDLRKPEMQKNLIMRHRVVKTVRDYFDALGFIEIETPVLAKSTPEGARDYLVPSRVHAGKFFALPQSPQLFKQLSMVAGFDRYFQVAKCFRDEDLRADRQPEFTQIDLEMSFPEREEFFSIMEGMVKAVWKTSLGIGVKTPFPRMTFDEAMSRFGSDKPDTRFGLELADISEEAGKGNFEVFKSILRNGGKVKGINASGCANFSKSQLKTLEETAKVFKAKGLVTAKVTREGLDSQVSKFFDKKILDAIAQKLQAKEGDLLLIVAGPEKIVSDSLSALRLHLRDELKLVKPDDFKFVWITDFPMFEWSEEEQRWNAMHHPFTSPRKEDIALLDRSPEKAKAMAYDLAVNGVELGGGSFRIYSQELQSKIFDILKISREDAQKKFGFLLEAFKYGAPPHGGIAFGLDRLVAMVTGNESIREVIAFPKNKACISMMDNAPSEVSARQLKELSIKLDLEEGLPGKKDKA
ncbi:MAG: aspartate--tRNA ligase [Candidatus Diapherotrites archaeon]|nr:aspartate--tRNA ligase [Candidatus Diapherotrites archaeon]